MPFKSKAQEGYLFAHDPQVAREYAAHTPKGEKLPEHVKKSGSKKSGTKKSSKKS